MEFQYKNRIFRVTRDDMGHEKEIRIKFNKSDKAHIHLFEIPVNEYPNAEGKDLDMFLGIFDDVNDLHDNDKIDGFLLKEEHIILYKKFRKTKKVCNFPRK